MSGGELAVAPSPTVRPGAAFWWLAGLRNIRHSAVGLRVREIERWADDVEAERDAMGAERDAALAELAAYRGEVANLAASLTAGLDRVEGDAQRLRDLGRGVFLVERSR